MKQTALGLGCGVFGGAYGPASQEEIVGAVRAALGSGIGLVDTSPYYNDSEARLGAALLELQAEFPRSSYRICTKVGRYGYRAADFDYSAARVVASVHESMRRLHTDYLDIVLCHDVEFVDLAQVTDVALPALLEMKRQGIVRQVGISGYPLDVLLRISQTQHERGSPLDVCLSYCNFNLHCRRLPAYVPALRAAGVRTVVAASPLSMGLLSQGATPAWHPAKPELKAAVARCLERVQLCQYTGSDSCTATLASIAEWFAFSYSDVDVHLVGAKTSDEVACALSAFARAQQVQLAGGGKFDDPELQRVYEEITEILRPFFDYAWPSPPADAY
ncbi:hypothetical protein H4R21_001986 [Coemansia helicoidea]|uniref:Uncharacterized protein n=1 Tax=Coemansia helicoidea TaxID=1286919 RepID=A0ACC1L982_9FUNG|nr:hypothetical protein H4R21_001986 [Coemansia helicoidea]